MRFSAHAARAIGPVAIWGLAMALCLLVVLRTEFTADMSAFLPKNPTVEQELLVDQLKEGILSRTLLIGIEGVDAAGRADLSRGLAQRMQTGGNFVSVRNGAADAMEQDRKLLFAHRYLLSPAVTAERFSVDGLRHAIDNSIDLLASPAGMLLKNLLPHDPTGEMIELLGTFDSDSSPASQFGVWASRDGRRAILMAQTQGAGSDTDAQQRAIAGIRNAFAAEAEARGIRAARVLISGAPVFAVEARATIQTEVTRLSIISAVGIVVLLLLAYRSVAALLFGLLPVVSGALAGIAAVSLGFGSVHGITIGFGTTLIGEAVDYTIYYFVQSRDDAGGDASWIERFWPTIRLGVLTSVCGFASLLLSGFPGLAQLGLYSIAGLVTAATVTRFVLPHLRPAGLRLRSFGNGVIGRLAARGIARLGNLSLGRWAVALLSLLAVLVIVNKQDQLWSDSLSGLSPVSATLRDQDMTLRSDLGAPDLRYLVVVSGGDREAALASTERAGAVLNTLINAQVIAGYDSAARFLPSRATQQQRRDALPERNELARRLSAATQDLPLRAEKLTPFLDDVAAARRQPLLDREQLQGSSLALAVDSLLMQRAAQGKNRWISLLPLHAGTGNEIDPTRIQQALDAAHIEGALCLDLAGESTRLYNAYLHEAILLSLAGFVAIALLLAFALRSPLRALRVLAPLAAAVLLVIAGLALAGEKLTLLHLVGMLLIVAVGSNYALFFDRPENNAALDPQTLSSLLLANMATLIGFGTLALARVPVLHAIGVTVGPGAVLALLLSAILAARPTRQEA